MKRAMPSPVKLIIRKATEIAARVCIYNIRQLVYLNYADIDTTMKWLPMRSIILNYLSH
ncbi:MAG: hypothetical protein QW431_03695 [Conexivisphaerales archaeon]